ncbi:MAG: DNA cytosine methyltransferase [Verrucomicrobiota bacterium]
MNESEKPKIGELFAGIGGFSIGFEKAGWQTSWQVEIDDIKRAVLGDRFPYARQFTDVREVSAEQLCEVDCIAAGFPCTNISNMGQRARGGRQGLKGSQSSLFFEVIRLAREIQPRWLVLENVPALLASNDHADIEAVIRALADCGYMGLWRVLDAQYFGVPQKRERIFLVCGLGEVPPLELLSDAAPVEAIPCSFASSCQPWAQADAWAGHTQTASNAASRISLGCELLVAEPNGWNQMDDRQRAIDEAGLCAGLDASNLEEVRGAGDAICPEIAYWIAEKLNAA